MDAQLAGIHLWNLRRAWAGANLCRDRLQAAHDAAPTIDLGETQVKDLRGNAAHDVDYYAWEGVRIMKISEKVTSAGLRGGPEVDHARAELEAEAPRLRRFRDSVTHVEDNRDADDVVYFGEAVRLHPGGRVEYVFDPRYRQHDLLGAVVNATESALLTLAVDDDGTLPRFDNSRA
jgi:hypothetical protein